MNTGGSRRKERVAATLHGMMRKPVRRLEGKAGCFRVSLSGKEN